MRVFYDPETLHPHHVITHMDWSKDELHDEIDHWFDIDHQHPSVHPPHLEVTRDANGMMGAKDTRTGKALPVVRRLPRFAINAVTQAKVGDVVGLTGIPDGTRIMLGGKEQGMITDGSGLVELVPSEPGPHHLSLRHDNFKPLDFVIEVLP